MTRMASSVGPSITPASPFALPTGAGGDEIVLRRRYKGSCTTSHEEPDGFPRQSRRRRLPSNRTRLVGGGRRSAARPRASHDRRAPRLLATVPEAAQCSRLRRTFL